jgi:hypothetical protein
LKKLSWPIGITLFYILFISGALSILFIALDNDDQLVKDDYYEKDLKYEEHVARLQNTKRDSVQLTFLIQKDSLFIQFPEKIEKFAANLHFYRAANRNLDQFFDEKGKNMIKKNISDLALGKWEIIVNWQSGSTTYFDKYSFFKEKK